MDIVTFFDPNNLEHLRAYRHLNSTGKWPEDFYEVIKDLKFSAGWGVGIQYKLAGAWVQHKLGA